MSDACYRIRINSRLLCGKRLDFHRGPAARVHAGEKTHLGPGMDVGIDRTWHGISIWRNGLVLNWMMVVVVQLQRLTKDHRCTRTLGTVWPVGDRSRSCQVWGERRQTRCCWKNPFSNLGNGWGRAVRPAALCGPRWSIRLTSFSFDPHPPAEDSDSSTEAPGLPPPSSPRPAATSAPGAEHRERTSSSTYTWAPASEHLAPCSRP